MCQCVTREGVIYSLFKKNRFFQQSFFFLHFSDYINATSPMQKHNFWFNRSITGSYLWFVVNKKFMSRFHPPLFLWNTPRKDMKSELSLKTRMYINSHICVRWDHCTLQHCNYFAEMFFYILIFCYIVSGRQLNKIHWQKEMQRKIINLYVDFFKKMLYNSFHSDLDHNNITHYLRLCLDKKR